MRAIRAYWAAISTWVPTSSHNQACSLRGFTACRVMAHALANVRRRGEPGYQAGNPLLPMCDFQR
jgi:hypothetical protein